MGFHPDTGADGGEHTRVRVNVVQARQLADLISAGVARLEAHSSSSLSSAHPTRTRGTTKCERGRGHGLGISVTSTVGQQEKHPDSASLHEQGDETEHQDQDQDQEDREEEEREAILTITSAATQLTALVRPPAQALLDVATSFTLCAALRLVVEANVPEVIRALALALTGTSLRRRDLEAARDEKHDTDTDIDIDTDTENKENKTDADTDADVGVGVPISDISRLCGVDSAKLERILRLLATHHIFVERPSPSFSPSPSPPRPCAPSDPDPDPGSGSSNVEAKRERKGDREREAHFANNRLSAALDSGAALEDIMGLSFDSVGVEEKRKKRWAAKYGAEAPGAGLAALVGLLTDESMFHATALTDVLLFPGSPPTPPTPQAPQAPPPSSPSQKEETTKNRSNPNPNPVPVETTDHPDPGPLLAPFSRARGLPHMTMFEWLSLPENAHRLQRFGCAMRGMGGLTPEGAILRGFDFASLPPGSTIIDVGGGVGAASLPILRAYPHLRLVVQDTEEVVKVAPSFWERHHPSALHSGLVSFQVQDFFDAQPDSDSASDSPSPSLSLSLCSPTGSTSTSTAKVFLLRMIMHNWPDAHCLRILARLRCAVREGEEARTKVVVVDSVLMRACREREGPLIDSTEPEPELEKEKEEEEWKENAKVKEAPEPLLANWGVANGLAYRLDLIMLANHNARERTLSAFESLLAQTGWRITEVHAASESWMPQIVAVPAPISDSSSFPFPFPMPLPIPTAETKTKVEATTLAQTKDSEANVKERERMIIDAETSPTPVGSPVTPRFEEKDSSKRKREDSGER